MAWPGCVSGGAEDAGGEADSVMVVSEAGAGSDQQGVAVRQTWSHSLVWPISDIKLTNQHGSGDQSAAGWYRKVNRW